MELMSCSRKISLHLLIWFTSGLHYNTLTLTKSPIFQDFTFLHNGNPLQQMQMLKPILQNLQKDLNNLHCTCPYDIRVHDLAIVAKNSDICAKILHFPSFFFLF
jgi:hypothetical protein